MGKINRERVLLGGLLGGVIIIVIDIFVNGVLFGQEWRAALTALGHAPSPSGLIILVIWAVLVGICATWLYAAARPRFSPGPKTAVITGFALWIFSYALPTIGLLSFHVFPSATSSHQRRWRPGGNHPGLAGWRMDIQGVGRKSELKIYLLAWRTCLSRLDCLAPALDRARLCSRLPYQHQPEMQY